MIRVNEKSIFSLIIFLFTAILLINTIGLRADVALVPRIAGLFLLLFSGLQTANDLFPFIQNNLPLLNKKVDSAYAIGGEGVIDEDLEGNQEKIRRMWFIGWMILFVALIYFIHMIGAIAVSMFLYLKWISKESWKLSILYPLLMALIVYLAFVLGLNINYFL